MDKNEAERFRKISIPIKIFLHARKYQTKVLNKISIFLHTQIDIYTHT